MPNQPSMIEQNKFARLVHEYTAYLQSMLMANVHIDDVNKDPTAIRMQDEIRKYGDAFLERDHG